METDELFLFVLVVVVLSLLAVWQAILVSYLASDLQVYRDNQEILLRNNKQLADSLTVCSANAKELYENFSALNEQAFEMQQQVSYWKSQAVNLQSLINNDIQSFCDSRVPSFVNVAKEVSEMHTYDIQNYNCVDFTADFNRKMREQGIHARQVNVVLDCPEDWSEEWRQTYCFKNDGGWKVRHAISEIIVYVDATAGVYIEPEYYSEWGLA